MDETKADAIDAHFTESAYASSMQRLYKVGRRITWKRSGSTLTALIASPLNTKAKPWSLHVRTRRGTFRYVLVSRVLTIDDFTLSGILHHD